MLLLPLGQSWQFGKKEFRFILRVAERTESTKTKSGNSPIFPKIICTSLFCPPPHLLRTCSPPPPPSSACTSQYSAWRTHGGSPLSPRHTGPPAWCRQGWRPKLGREEWSLADSPGKDVANQAHTVAPYFCHQVSRQVQWSPSQCIHWAAGSIRAGN